MKFSLIKIIINPLFILFLSIITHISFIVYLYKNPRNHNDNIYFYVLFIITIISIVFSIIERKKYIKPRTDIFLILSIILIIIIMFLSFIISITGNFMLYALIFNIWVLSFLAVLVTSIISFIKKSTNIIYFIFILSVFAVFAGVNYLEIKGNNNEKLMDSEESIEYIYEDSDEIIEGLEREIFESNE